MCCWCVPLHCPVTGEGGGALAVVPKHSAPHHRTPDYSTALSNSGCSVLLRDVLIHRGGGVIQRTPPPPKGCVAREGTSEAVGQAVGGGCQSGCLCRSRTDCGERIVSIAFLAPIPVPPPPPPSPTSILPIGRGTPSVPRSCGCCPVSPAFQTTGSQGVCPGGPGEGHSLRGAVRERCAETPPLCAGAGRRSVIQWAAPPHAALCTRWTTAESPP